MDILVLDTNFNTVDVVSVYESLIWTDRYNSCGDFELFLPMDNKILASLRDDYYLWVKESDHTMIVEKIAIDSDIEDGNKLTVTGRSLECLLERRIIWGQKAYTGNFQDAIHNMLDDAFINPSDDARKVDNFVFRASEDPKITELTIDAEYTGDDLYSVISGLCAEKRIGFKIELTDDNKFEFSLYAGVDRSHNQTENPYVIFSPNFENIINTNYYSSKAEYRNVTLVVGEGDEFRYRQKVTVGDEVSGLQRRELYTDAGDVSADTEEWTLSNAEYLDLLKSTGEQKLSEHKIQTAFEGEVDATQLYTYGEDFFIGDILEFANEYGHEGRVYVSELIISHSDTGVSIYPTFKLVEEEESE